MVTDPRGAVSAAFVNKLSSRFFRRTRPDLTCRYGFVGAAFGSCGRSDIGTMPNEEQNPISARMESDAPENYSVEVSSPRCSRVTSSLFKKGPKASSVSKGRANVGSRSRLSERELCLVPYGRYCSTGRLVWFRCGAGPETENRRDCSATGQNCITNSHELRIF